MHIGYKYEFYIQACEFQLAVNTCPSFKYLTEKKILHEMINLKSMRKQTQRREIVEEAISSYKF